MQQNHLKTLKQKVSIINKVFNNFNKFKLRFCNYSNIVATRGNFKEY